MFCLWATEKLSAVWEIMSQVRREMILWLLYLFGSLEKSITFRSVSVAGFAVFKSSRTFENFKSSRNFCKKIGRQKGNSDLKLGS